MSDSTRRPAPGHGRTARVADTDPAVGSTRPRDAGEDRDWVMLTVFGACAVTFMMVMYALERRGRRFVLAFAVGCGLSSTYGFLAGTWPFGIVEGIWSIVAVKRYLDQQPPAGRASDHPLTEVGPSSAGLPK
jgi:hypothetical protein